MPPSDRVSPPSWYHAGLKFTCTQCGNCCTGDPGFTWVNEGEIAALAGRLGVDVDTFRKRYTRTVWRRGEERITLVEKRGGECVFYRRGVGCTVYQDRPKQCRTWPFWERVVESQETWTDAGRECPGIGRGALHAASEIAAHAADDGLA